MNVPMRSRAKNPTFSVKINNDQKYEQTLKEDFDFS